MKKILIGLTLTVIIQTTANSITCPSLKGNYLCPGNSGFPDFTLVITQTMDDERTYAEYIYSYPELGLDDEKVIASSKGELNKAQKPYWAICFEDALIFFKQDSTTGAFQTTALTPSGNLEVFVNGEEAIECLRKSEGARSRYHKR